MLSAFCFTLSRKRKITNPFNSSQDIIPKITSRDAKGLCLKKATARPPLA